jgi:hypothetical protein
LLTEQLIFSRRILQKIKRTKYCNGFAQSIARQQLDKQPTTDLHATIEGRPSLGYARYTHAQQYEEFSIVFYCYAAATAPMD